MPAKSKAQRRLFGLALAYKNGDLGPGKTSGIVKSISTLYNKLNKLSDAGYKIRKKK